MNYGCIRLPGHPDAVCDLLAEAIVDEYMRRDPASRIRLAVIGGRGALFISGDIISQADFDVAHLMSRTLGSLGVLAELEPFVSLEQVVAERATFFRTGIEAPVAVVGYATHETSEMVPATVASARRIAKLLEERRKQDERWFWLGGDGEVSVAMTGRSQRHVCIRVEHSTYALADVRAELTKLVHTVESDAHVSVNELGADDTRGIGNMIGASGREPAPYGFMLPFGTSGIGQDVAQPEKAGAWLARAAARSLVARGAKAALVRALYRPGMREPSMIAARDERGRDLSQDISRKSMSLDRIREEWWRPQLNTDAARWGFAGEAGLPWEM